ncbi:hypothetical protein BC828DRAFT_407546 [Blastocladiella britannica]|nr:hypothetical protein BC828DRAFT_407546 [Blastocladiella britannica]
MRDLILFLALAAGLAYAISLAVSRSLARYLEQNYRLTFTAISWLTISGIQWKVALPPRPLLHAAAAGATAAATAAGAKPHSVLAAVAARLAPAASSAGADSTLEGNVRMAISSIRLHIKWDAFRRRGGPRRESSASSPLGDPSASAVPDPVAGSEALHLHAFTLMIDHIAIDADVSEQPLMPGSQPDLHRRAPSTTRNEPSSPDTTTSSSRRRQPPRRTGSASRTGLFSAIFGGQVQALLMQFAVYALVRWVDILITRIVVRGSITSVCTTPAIPASAPTSPTTSPHVPQAPFTSQPTSPSSPTATRIISKMDWCQDMVHLWGSVAAASISTMLSGSQTGASAGAFPTEQSSHFGDNEHGFEARPLGETASGDLPTASSASLPDADPFAPGSDGEMLHPSSPSIDMHASLSPATFRIDHRTVISTAHATQLRVSYQLSRPLPASFVRPSLVVSVAPIVADLTPLLDFFQLHRGVLEALERAEVFAKQNPGSTRSRNGPWGDGAVASPAGGGVTAGAPGGRPAPSMFGAVAGAEAIAAAGPPRFFETAPRSPSRAVSRSTSPTRATASTSASHTPRTPHSPGPPHKHNGTSPGRKSPNPPKPAAATSLFARIPPHFPSSVRFSIPRISVRGPFSTSLAIGDVSMSATIGKSIRESSADVTILDVALQHAGHSIVKLSSLDVSGVCRSESAMDVPHGQDGPSKPLAAVEVKLDGAEVDIGPNNVSSAVQWLLETAALAREAQFASEAEAAGATGDIWDSGLHPPVNQALFGASPTSASSGMALGSSVSTSPSSMMSMGNGPGRAGNGMGLDGSRPARPLSSNISAARARRMRTSFLGPSGSPAGSPPLLSLPAGRSPAVAGAAALAAGPLSIESPRRLSQHFPPQLCRILDLVDLEVEIAFMSPILAITPVPDLALLLQADHLHVHVGATLSPVLEADFEFSLGHVGASILPVPSTSSAAGDPPIPITKLNLADESCPVPWVLAKVDIVRIDALITEIEPSDASLALERAPTSSSAAGDPLLANPWNAPRVNLQLEASAHHPHVALHASDAMAAPVASLLVLIGQLKGLRQQHSAQGPFANNNINGNNTSAFTGSNTNATRRNSPPSLMLMSEAATKIMYIIALHYEAKISINRPSFSISADPPTDSPDSRHHAAERGMDGAVDCVIVQFSGKRLIGPGAGQIAVISALAHVEPSGGIGGSSSPYNTAAPVPPLDFGLGLTQRASLVDEVVVEVDGVRVRRNPKGANDRWRHVCGGSAQPSVDDITSAAAARQPTSDGSFDASRIVFASRLTAEIKMVDTAQQAPKDVYPRRHRHISAAVTIDEELVVGHSIAIHLLIERVLSVLVGLGLQPPPQTPSMFPKGKGRAPSLTSLAGAAAPIVTFASAIKLASLSLQLDLPEETQLQARFDAIEARADMHASDDLCANAAIRSVDILGNKSKPTLFSQAMHPSIFLGEREPRELDPWGNQTMYPLCRIERLGVDWTNVTDAVVSADSFDIWVPHNYFIRDVLENVATFVKIVKPSKPPPPPGTAVTPSLMNVQPVRFCLRRFKLAMEDDPFEARLNTIFRYGKDQQRSRLEREHLLAEKLRSVPNLDHRPFWAELESFHSREWAQIMAAARAAAPVPLFNFVLTEVELHMSAPTLPLANIASSCHIIDRDTPSNAEFDFTLARDVVLQLKSLIARVRDYTLPLIHLPPPTAAATAAAGAAGTGQARHMLHGLLILAEPIAPATSECLLSIPILTSGSVKSVQLRKVLSPIKLYSSLNWRLDSPMTIHWGLSVEAGLSDAVRVIDQFTDPSFDPSVPMPWWDKMRWLLHGKLQLEGEALHIHLLGSRNPYYSLFSGDGSHGVVISALGRSPVPSRADAFPGLGDAPPAPTPIPETTGAHRGFKLTMTSLSGTSLNCSEFEVAVVQPLVNHNSTNGTNLRRPAPDGESEALWDNGPCDREVVMALCGNVLLSVEPVFECVSPRPSHHTVFGMAPEHVKAGLSAHDSFAMFRSQRLFMSVRIKSVQSGFSRFDTFACTPANIAYAIQFVNFNLDTKATTLRRGDLFPLATPKYPPKKLSLFFTRFALRVELAPVLISLWHKDKSIHSPNDAVGLRSIVDRCHIDFHTARFRGSDNSSTPQPWYIDTTDIDFSGLELRCLVLSDVPSHGGTPYLRHESTEEVRVRLANSYATLYVSSIPFFWTPKLSYCRSSDVDYGRESSFGRDINRVQLQLLKEYLAAGNVPTTAQQVIEQRITQMQQTDFYHVDQDDYVHSFVIHNSRLMWNVAIRAIVMRFIELQSQASLLQYYTSNSSLRILRDLRELLRQRDAFEKTNSGASMEPILESFARRTSMGTMLRAPSAAQIAKPPVRTDETDREILHNLLGSTGSVFVSDEDLRGARQSQSQSQAHSQPDLAHELPLPGAPGADNDAPPADMIVKSMMIQFINPQIKLCTVPQEEGPDGACFVTTENTFLTQHDVQRHGILIKTVTSVDISDANFTVTATRESAAFYGLAAPYLRDRCPEWLPMECFFTASNDGGPALFATLRDSSQLPLLLPEGFVLVVHRAGTRMQLQRLNLAISDKGVDDSYAAASQAANDDQNAWHVEFDRFSIHADPLAFSVLFNVVSKLLIYREPARARRQEQLDLLLLAAQAEDIRVLLDSILQLRSEIFQLRMALNFDVSVLQDGHVDIDGTQRWVKILSRLAEMEDHLLVVMESFKLMNSGPQRIRLPNNSGGGGGSNSGGYSGGDASGREAAAIQSQFARQRSRSTSQTNLQDPGGETPVALPSNVRTVYETVVRAVSLEWNMLTLEGQSIFMQWRLTGLDFCLLDFSDQSRAFNLSIQQLAAWNKLPHPIYEEVANVFYHGAASLPEFAQGFPATLPPMIQVYWHELAPVAGIAVVSTFELGLFPTKLGLTYDLGKQFLNYVFPVKATTDANTSGSGANLAKSASNMSLAKAAAAGNSSISGGSVRDRESILGGGNGSVRKRSRGDISRSSSTDALTQMRTRASKNTTFIAIRIPKVVLCISYRGNKEKNIEDIQDFVLTLPTMAYNNKTWTWLEFMTQVRRDILFAVLGHTGQLLRDKMFSRRPLPQTPPVPDLPHHLHLAGPSVTVTPGSPLVESPSPMSDRSFPAFPASGGSSNSGGGSGSAAYGAMPRSPTTTGTDMSLLASAARTRHARSASEGQSRHFRPAPVPPPLPISPMLPRVPSTTGIASSTSLHDQQQQQHQQQSSSSTRSSGATPGMGAQSPSSSSTSSSSISPPTGRKDKPKRSKAGGLFGAFMAPRSTSNSTLSEEDAKRKMLLG